MNRITKSFPLAVVIAFFILAIPMANSFAAEYVVQPGDNLTKIAARYGTSAYAIAEANSLADVNSIYVGQVLQVPDAAGVQHVAVPTPAVAPSIAQASIYHRVYGDARFVSQTHQILQWLQAHDPTVFHFTNALVDSIQPGPYHYAEARNLFYGYGTPSVRCEVYLVLTGDVLATASLLYHEAVHCEQGKTGRLHVLSEAQSEVEAYERQKIFALAHGAPAWLVDAIMQSQQRYLGS